MTDKPLLERIDSIETLNQHLDALVQLDPRLEPVREIAGEVPLRLGQPGFAGMVSIIVSQLLSVASADAIHKRVVSVLGDVSAERFLEIEEEQVRNCGLSGGKYRTMCTIAEAELSGALDYTQLPDLEIGAAMVELTKLKGIGPWTAEIYLLSSVGHADVFPAGDLALQKMVGHALGRKKKPDEKQTRKIAAKWSPYRGAAARLMWRYFAALKSREGINL